MRTPDERPPRVGVLVFPGSNDDRDAAWALSALGAEPVLVWHAERELPRVAAVVLPGGFSYGDYLRTGAMARIAPAMRAVSRFAADGGLVLGICNGFQILCEAHLLPGAMMQNAGLAFVSKPVDVIVERADTVFTSVYERGARLRLPVAHGEGRFVAAADTLRALEAEGRVVLRYVAATESSPGEPNPNGSANHIAGICNAEGNVVGIMPHPERAADPALGNCDGSGFFASMAAWQPLGSSTEVPDL